MNPRAGSGRAVGRWQKVESRLVARGFRVMTLLTSRSRHATELATQAFEMGYTTLVAVGGDGTIHEVVNGLIHTPASREHVRLAVVPAGTGMDFARNLGLRRGIEADVQRIVRAVERRVDVGVARDREERLFVNFAETGIGAAVVAAAAALDAPLPGRASFLFAAVDAARKMENVQTRVTVDGTVVFDDRAVSVVVANGKYFGGGMKIAPLAAVDDGLLDVLVLGDFSRSELIAQIWKVYPGMHLEHPKVVWRRGARVVIEPTISTRLDLDGELYGSGPYVLWILPRALSVLI